MVFNSVLYWVSEATKIIQKSVVALIQEFVDVNKYSGLRSPKDKVLKSTLDNVAYHRNTILACLFGLLSTQFTLVKSAVWMLTCGLILITLALKCHFKNASIETLRNQVEVLGIPAFAALTTIPSFGLFITITLKYFQATIRPGVVPGFVLVNLIAIYSAGLVVGIWEHFFLGLVVVWFREVFGGRNEMDEEV
ncbi:hypothetical protein JAAARDRAFT_198980 [Jaapia argillacea MUCL 33604]|uniref:Uncharacterized protein n=1 Tax=Jaapia argillacea MUCL 33604 TaxID=933084 RepID=A0A067PMF8_9AGAM|nr:hypothetical protein JAAARDRAFT_198980 [Jaapia argillacea MUCL 33604]